MKNKKFVTCKCLRMQESGIKEGEKYKTAIGKNCTCVDDNLDKFNTDEAIVTNLK